MPRSLRCAVLAGDWIPVSLPNRLRRLADGVQVIASGGPTETTIWDIWYPVDHVDPAWSSIPYGKPMGNTHYYVLNRALEPCPVWVAGQIHIGGAGLARGYWRDPAKTRERFIIHPQTGERIYASGDMGRYLPDGNIEFLGRDDLQVKIRGHRVELGEIEAALKEHPALDGAAVAALGETRQLTRLVAFVVPGGTGPAGGNGQDPAAFKQEYLAGVSVLDPAARIDFKLNQWGIRRDTDRAVLAFPHEERDEAVHRAEAERRSVRAFSPNPLPFAALGELLRSLTQIDAEDLPKYRYPSGGGLYPVQTYVYVKPGRVENVAGGVYYHDPKGHRLLLMSPGALLQADTQMPHNRALFDKAAFVILLIGQRAAVEPLYGGLASDFCLLEAGYMSQLLMTVAPRHQIGLCPVGAMEFEPVRPFFQLDDSHVLAHLLIGGLPVTSDGKVDRRQLPSLEVAHAADQRPDAPPRNQAERALAAIVQKILDIGSVGIEQNFFDLGGGSVQMVQIMNEVRKAFGREVPITEIFRHPTISSLAGYLSADDDAEPAGAGSDERASQRRASVARRNASRRERPASGQDGALPC